MKLAAISVSFTGPGGKSPANGKSRTKEEAKAKAEELVSKIRAGADFAALAKTESDDPSSGPKGGEMGTFTAGSKNIPAPIMAAVTKLKKGEVTDPLEQQNGYWIIYMTDHAQKSYPEARQSVIDRIHGEHANEVMQRTLKQYAIQVQDSDFFSTAKPEESTAPKIPSLQNPPPK
jgi:parvulin-like peptidyl-prolyl isomerase